MGIEVRVPVLPESVSDATVVTWHKQPGDTVRREETLVDIETDKVVFEVPAPGDGILSDVCKGQGETVGSEEVLAVIEPAAVPAPALAPAVATTSSTETQAEAQGLSPAVRHLVMEYQLDPAQIIATGKDGRLTKADVLNYLTTRNESREPAPRTPQRSIERPPTLKPVADTAERGIRRESMSRLRARIAERLLESQQTTAALTTFNEVNMQAVFDLRARYRDRFEEKHQTKLGLMSFFVKATVEALKQYPIINASVEGNDILYHDYYNIGIAVASPRGLVVPTLKQADTLGFAEIEQSITDFATRAREGKLAIEELSGGTFSISNGGIFGSLLSTPILNPPQSAILGMHKIQERPVAEAGEVKIRPMMYLALTYDHRLIDGKDAVRFLVTIKETLEDPARLLLAV